MTASWVVEPCNCARPAKVLEIANLNLTIASSLGDLPIVRGADLDIGEGEAVALIGESGSGKSMLASTILGLQPVNSTVEGSIKLNGLELVGLRARAFSDIRGREIAMIDQQPMSSMNPSYTIGEQIGETIRRHLAVSRTAARKRTAELLDIVGIPAASRRMDDYPHMFSGGMLQRASIAMALSCDPKVLIADEPTTALDATIQAQVLDLFAQLREQMKMSLLFLTHDLGAVAALCDKVAVMYAGKIVERSLIEPIFDRPLHPYTEGLLGSITRLDVEEPPTIVQGSVPPPWALPPGCAYTPRCPYALAECSKDDVPRSVGGRVVRCRRASELTLKGVS